jgi:uncharacterized protein (DUF1501 family)
MGSLFISIGVTAPAFITRTAEVAQAAKLAERTGKTLIVVQLSGGNDGLNTVVPYSNPLYQKVRPTIGLTPSEYLPIDDNLALHAEMQRLKGRFDNGQVAIIENVGYPNPNRSHFRSMEIWQTAIPEKYEPSGWVGRYLDATCTGFGERNIVTSTEAFNVGGSLPLAFWTTHVMVPTIGTVQQFQFQTDGEYPDDRQNQIDSIARIYSQSSSSREYDDYVRSIGKSALETSEKVQQVAKTYQPQAQYSNDPFSQNMKMIGQLMKADLGTRLYYVALGGFDTHARQARTQAGLLKSLSEGVDAFMSDMEAQGRGDDVLIMAFSEFGRRVTQNGSDGTDHGTAAPMFVFGHAVKGGIHGTPPNLDDLDNGDLKFDIDFRSVYAGVLDNWLDTKSEDVLGAKFPAVNFIA